MRYEGGPSDGHGAVRQRVRDPARSPAAEDRRDLQRGARRPPLGTRHPIHGRTTNPSRSIAGLGSTAGADDAILGVMATIGHDPEDTPRCEARRGPTPAGRTGRDRPPSTCCPPRSVTSWADACSDRCSRPSSTTRPNGPSTPAKTTTPCASCSPNAVRAGTRRSRAGSARAAQPARTSRRTTTAPKAPTTARTAGSSPGRRTSPGHRRRSISRSATTRATAP